MSSTTSYFQYQSPRTNYAGLNENISSDVCIIGAGVVGTTLAFLLKDSGKSVTLLEARTIGSGTTGHSTAKLTTQHGLIYSFLTRHKTGEDARRYFEMNQAALEFCASLDIECDLFRKSHTVFTALADEVDNIQTEYEACCSLGIPCRLATRAELEAEIPMDAICGVTFENQIEFNPVKYCQELARLVKESGSQVYEHTRVVDVKEDETSNRVVLENGFIVDAKFVVVATHLPILDRSLHFSLFVPSRSHCIAVEVESSPVSNMFIRVEDPKRSIRSVQGTNVLIIAGNTLPQGEGSSLNAYQDLEHFARTHYAVKNVVARWSAVDFMSSDRLPSVGYLHNKSNTVLTAVGFNKWGLSTGIAAGMTLKNLIMGIHDPYLNLIDSKRWDLLGAVKENIHVGRHLVQDKLHEVLHELRPEAISLGGGDVGRFGAHVIGVHKNEQGQLLAIKPTCTHLGCTLKFSDGDREWHCPCHGSVFDTQGNVMHGPAVKGLRELNIDEW
ncbi:hypothetical protein RCL1_002478 [Eukaryota sp. TZLM3-RCL]